MYGYNPQLSIERLRKQKEEIDNLINNYQQMPQQQPINNIINQNTPQQTGYELKVLNDNDEAENIGILNDTIFIGGARMQIKRTDGTIEKYNIEKYYPVDPKDEQIKALNKKVEELERRLNDEYTKHTKSINASDKSNGIDDVIPKPKSTASSK